MKKLLLLVCIMPLVTACDGKFIKSEFTSSECVDGGSPLDMNGYTATAIHYGDSRLIVQPISEIKANSEFRFIMVPRFRSSDAIDYANVKVVITSEDDGGDTPANWLEKSGDYNDGTLTVCVPPAPNQTTYKYKVTVLDGATEVGMLDPRAELIPE